MIPTELPEYLENTRVLCAVSGGADSVFLLRLLLELGADLCAAHYNHGLRGDESDRDEAFVRELCGGWGVPLEVGSGDVALYAREHRLGTEEAARVLRYDFLEQARVKLGAELIATAHTADDNAETVLLNLARGSGLRGLGGIPPRRGNIVRPILSVTRREIESYLAKRDITHVEDSTNSSDDYARNRIRHAAVPALKSVNKAFCETASRTALLLREDEEFLQSLADGFLREHLTERGVPVSELCKLPRPVSSRVVRSMAKRSLPQSQVESVLSLALGGTTLARVDVTGGSFTREGGYLKTGRGGGEKLPDRELPGSGVLELPEINSRLVITGEICPDGINSSLNTFFFNCDSICGKILVTSRRAGDRIRLAGRGCTKRLSDIFTEMRLTQEERNSVCVLRDGMGVVAVFGVGAAERCVSKPGEPALKIELISES